MRSVIVVAASPLLDDHPGLGQACKDLSIQTLTAERAVEPFVAGILPWPPRIDIGQCDAAFFHLLAQDGRDDLAAVVATDGSRTTAAGDQSSQQPPDMTAVQMPTDLDGQTIAGRFVLDGQTAQRLRVVIAVMNDIPGPYVIASQCQAV